MVIQRLELCIELLKFVIEFVVVFIEAVGTVITESTSQVLSARPAYILPTPYVGLLP